MKMSYLHLRNSSLQHARAGLSILGELLKRLNAFARAFELPRTPDFVIYGDPRYEAWTADGEPLDRMTPQEYAQLQPSRHLIVPHGRAR
jgi:hypothetical protein